MKYFINYINIKYYTYAFIILHPVTMDTIAENVEYPITIKRPKNIKRFIQCPDDVIAGHLITKEYRHELHGTVAGGKGSMNPEIYQRSKIVEGTGVPCSPTIVRINKRTGQMHEIAHPMKYENGFDYTENFDGVQKIGETTIWINFTPLKI